MTIEQKALELIKQARSMCRTSLLSDVLARDLADELECALEDKARHAAELREQAERFSEAVTSWLDLHTYSTAATDLFKQHFAPFILAPVDPLAEVMRGTGCQSIQADTGGAELLKQTADRLGYTFAIVKKEAVNG